MKLLRFILPSFGRGICVLLLLAYSSVFSRLAPAQDLGTSSPDVLGIVDTTVGFNDYTDVNGVYSYASADLLDMSLADIDGCSTLEPNSLAGICWVGIEDQLFQNGYLVADPSNDCDPVDYEYGNCDEDEYPWSIAADADAAFVVDNNYDIHGWSSLAYYDVNNNGASVYDDLLFSDGSNYLDYSFDANPPNNISLDPSYGVLGTSGQITVTGNYLIDPWPSSSGYAVATPPASDNGLSFPNPPPYVASYPGPTDNTITLNYSITSAAPTGNRQFTMTNRFGASSPVTFTVADASPTFTNPNVGTLVAGNQYSINISGANFGKNPQVSETGPAGVTFNLQVSGNTITGTITLASGTSAGPIIITLTSEGASGNGFVGPQTPTVTATGAVQPTPAAAPFIVARPLYAVGLSQSDQAGNCSTNSPLVSNPTVDGSGNVTYTVNNVLVGQQINITGCAPANGGIAVQDATWIPNPSSAPPTNSIYSTTTAVGGFVVTMNKNNFQFAEMIMQAPSAPTCQATQSCDFATLYFIKPGTYEFQFSYTLTNGSSASPNANAIFNVVGPTPDAQGHFMAGVNGDGQLAYPPPSGPVQVYGVGQLYEDGNPYNSVPALANGDGNVTYGINLFVTGTVPSDGNSEGWFFVQTINPLSFSYLSSPPSNPFILQPGLDTVYPNIECDVGACFQDAPWMGLDVLNFGKTSFNAVGEESESARFTTYLLWDPGLNPAVLPPGVNSCSTASAIVIQDGPTTYNQSTCSSVPVPMDAVAWGFSGDAIKTLNPTQHTAQRSAADSWYLSDGSESSPQYVPAAYPQWSFTEIASQFNQ